MENKEKTTTTEEEKTEKRKEKAYSVLDFLLGALIFGIFIGLVALSANGMINLFTKWFPSLKKQSTNGS
jgi:hypothetical protein